MPSAIIVRRHWEVATTVTSTDGHEPYALWIVEPWMRHANGRLGIFSEYR